LIDPVCSTAGVPAAPPYAAIFSSIAPRCGRPSTTG
jgi:hypothetical protein